MKDIKDLVYTSRDVGRAIKSSKHEYIWEFTVDDQRVMIQYFISYVSLKRKILYNKKVISREYCSNNYYSHEFDMDGHNYKVSETFNFSDLLIDGVSFDHLYTLQKNSNEFSKEQRPTTYYVKTESYYTGDKSRIQRSNEINLRKKENKDERILNFSFKANNLRNNNNNLRKFKFNDKEKHLNIETNNNNKTFVIPSKNNYNNFNTVQNNNKKINLIDLDDDSFDNNNNKQDDNKNDFNSQKNNCSQNNNLIDTNDFNNQIFDIRKNSNLNNNTKNYNKNNKNNNNFNLLDLNIFNNNNSKMNNNNINFNNNNNNNNMNNNYNYNIQNNNNISNNNSNNFNKNNNLNNLVDYFN